MGYPLSNTPGVQVDEVALGAPPILGVSTNVGGFVGIVLPANRDPKIAPGTATPVTSEDEFRDLFANGATKSTDLTRAVIGFFKNGGTKCYVVPADAAAGLLDGVKALEVIDDVNIIAVPGSVDKDIRSELQGQADRKHDRFAILDPPPKVANPVADFATSGAGGNPGPQRPQHSFFSAFYYPRILVGKDFPDDPKDGEFVPPSGHIAGIYARVDQSKGVHKAPANEIIRGALDVEQRLTDNDQNSLNADNINLLRNFVGDVTIWGGRTMVKKDPDGQALEYHYISTRRLVNYVEQSLKNGLRFAVFEPNNLPLRQRLTRSIRGFLDGVWRDGALFGETPNDAYYVRFPPNYNRDEDRKAGLLVVEIGLRISYPAEFIIIRIGPLADSPNA